MRNLELGVIAGGTGMEREDQEPGGDSLPAELWEKIFNYLPREDYAATSFVDMRFYQAMRDVEYPIVTGAVKALERSNAEIVKSFEELTSLARVNYPLLRAEPDGFIEEIMKFIKEVGFGYKFSRAAAAVETAVEESDKTVKEIFRRFEELSPEEAQVILIEPNFRQLGTLPFPNSEDFFVQWNERVEIVNWYKKLITGLHEMVVYNVRPSLPPRPDSEGFYDASTSEDHADPGYIVRNDEETEEET